MPWNSFRCGRLLPYIVGMPLVESTKGVVCDTAVVEVDEDSVVDGEGGDSGVEDEYG